MNPIKVAALVPNPAKDPYFPNGYEPGAPNWIPGVYLIHAEHHPDNPRAWRYTFTTDTTGRLVMASSMAYQTKKQAMRAAVEYVKVTYRAHVVTVDPATLKALPPGPIPVKHK